MYFGWFLAFLGLVIGIASKKGYELLGGKENKAKPISVLISSLLCVVVAQIAVYLIGIMSAYSSEAGTSISLSQAAEVFMITLEYDSSVLGSVILDLILSWVFVIIGIFPMIKELFTGANSTASKHVRLGKK